MMKLKKCFFSYNGFIKSAIIPVIHFSLIFITLTFSSCGLYKGVKLIKSKTIEPVYFNTESKTIILVPNTHFGQPEFYADLTDSIYHWKSEGYRIYYEMVDTDVSDPLYEINEKKWRKINGESSDDTSEGYEAELQGVFKSGVGQPSNEALGITEDDLNADINFKEFIRKIEELHGEIVLDSCDLQTPLDSTYTCSKIKGIKSHINYVMVNYRNETVVKFIEDNNDSKIVVIYGMEHINGIKKLLDNKLNK